MRINNITLDWNTGSKQSPSYFAYDMDQNFLVIDVIKHEIENTELPIAFFKRKLADGTEELFQETVKVKTNKCTFKVPNKALNAPGKLQCQLKYVSASGVCSSAMFTVEVKESIDITGAVTEDDENYALFANIIAEWEQLKLDIQQGTDGDSAYEVAVESGFVGTEIEWLASLKGDAGPQGVQGPAGTNGLKGEDGYSPVKGVDYFDGATGPKGDKGEQGIQGPKGDRGEVGQTGAQGPQGIMGATGQTGQSGVTGPEGRSAYWEAVHQGFTGSEAEWLTSLKGDKGEKGDSFTQDSALPYLMVNGFKLTIEEV